MDVGSKEYEFLIYVLSTANLWELFALEMNTAPKLIEGCVGLVGRLSNKS
jgi:hypothetical protein